MPDNTLLNTGSGGDTIRDIAKGDAKTQLDEEDDIAVIMLTFNG